MTEKELEGIPEEELAVIIMNELKKLVKREEIKREREGGKMVEK